MKVQRVGAASVDITPLIPVPMAGYPPIRLYEGGPSDHRGYQGRVGPSEGVHDPIYARATALDDGESVAVVVGLDVCVVCREFTDRVRKAASERWGLAPEAIMLAASHSHSGPDFGGYWEPGPDGVEDFIAEMTLSAIGQALARRRPALMAVSKGLLAEPVINRRDSARPVDAEVAVVRFDDLDGRTIAVLFGFACHPIVAGSANRLITAEFPGFAALAIEDAFEGSVAVFLNGAAGNINPVAFPYSEKANVSVKSRETALAGQPVTFRSIAEAARLGALLGAEVVRASIGTAATEPFAVSYHRRPARLRLKGEEDMEKFLLHVPHEPSQEAKLRGREWLDTEVSAIRIGGLVLLGFPGEPFVEIGLQLQRQDSGDPAVRVVGYANDYPGYVLPPSDYDENRYENVATPLAREGAEELIKVAEEVRRWAIDGR